MLFAKFKKSQTACGGLRMAANVSEACFSFFGVFLFFIIFFSSRTVKQTTFVLNWKGMNTLCQ